MIGRVTPEGSHNTALGRKAEGRCRVTKGERRTERLVCARSADSAMRMREEKGGNRRQGKEGRMENGKGGEVSDIAEGVCGAKQSGVVEIAHRHLEGRPHPDLVLLVIRCGEATCRKCGAPCGMQHTKEYGKACASTWCFAIPFKWWWNCRALMASEQPARFGRIFWLRDGVRSSSWKLGRHHKFRYAR